MKGPTQTDEDDTGYLVEAFVSVVPEAITTPVDLRIKFEKMVLFEEEDPGATHVGLFVRAAGPGVDREIFRWNNGGNEVEQVFGFDLGNSPDPQELTLTLTGITAIYVEAYADSDEEWPRAGASENFLGAAMIVIDPSDPATSGRRRMGPTMTDNDDAGYQVSVTLELLPSTPAPDLSIARLEVTQAIQHTNSVLGADNSVPLVANKLTMVRVYIDSGIEFSVNYGQIPGVTGTLFATGSGIFNLGPIQTITARPLDKVDPEQLDQTLNFLIPPEMARGTLAITVEATVAGNVSNPQQVTITFSEMPPLDIVVVRLYSPGVGPVTDSTYYDSMNRLTEVYPIPSDPAVAIRYWMIPHLSSRMNFNFDLNTLQPVGKA